MDMTRRLARAIGPSLAGALVALLPLSSFFVLDTVSFVISAAAVLLLGRRFAWKPERSPSHRGGIGGIVSEIAGAVRTVRAHGPLAWAMSSLGVSNLAWGAAFTVGAPLLADRVLAGQVGAYGLIVGAYGVGNVIGNIVVGSMNVKRRLAMLFAGRVVLGAGFLIMGTATTLPVAIIGSAVAAFGGPMGDIVLLTMIQHDLPANQIGKVYSLRMTIANAGISLGAVIAAPLYATFAVGVAIALCAALIAMTGFVGFLRYGITEPASPIPA